MPGTIYKAYIGGWEQGDPFPLYVPTGTIDDYVNGSYTIQSATRNFPWFDHTVTYFARNSTIRDSAISQGFLPDYVVDLNEGSIRVYVDPNSYILISPQQMKFYKNAQSIGTFGQSGVLSPLPLLDPGGSYGAYDITNIATNSFNLITRPVLFPPINEFFADIEPFIDSTDPYEQDPDGESETGGGTGNFDGTGEDINIPGLPALSAVDTGFITLFNPSEGELKNLANYMWGDLFDLDTWKKIFADPMDAILGLSIVPVAVPNGGSATVTVGNISTGVSMNKAAAQYVEVDCGTLNVNEYWGAYLDYDPYTKAEIYLPYIGTHPLAVDDIMNKSVHVVYHIDILSGACCAYVKCGSSVLYSFVGQCSCSIPITGSDWTNVVNGALSIAAAIGTMVATGGATAPMAATTIASTAVNSMKPNVEKSGSMGGMGGMLGVQTPYLILTRPRQALPARQNSFMGYPSFITLSLEDCSGYTEIESIHLENIPATEQELSEIERLLKGGVIL